MYKKLFFVIAALMLFATSAEAQQNKGLTVLDALTLLGANENTIVGPGLTRGDAAFNNQLFFGRASNNQIIHDVCLTVIIISGSPTFQFFDEDGANNWPQNLNTLRYQWEMNTDNPAAGVCVTGVGSIHSGCDGGDCSYAYRLDRLQDFQLVAP